MLSTQDLCETLSELGFNFYSGVPCSFLTPLINYTSMHSDYVAATNEGDAVATCAGAYLGGRKSVFLCQNSGLTNACSPLTSLLATYDIPLLGFVSLRGDPDLNDEPQHVLMGKITTRLLEQMNIVWEYLSDDWSLAQQQLVVANQTIEQGKSFVFVVKKSTLSSVSLTGDMGDVAPVLSQLHDSHGDDELPRREQALQVVSQVRDEQTLLLTTTGYTSRECCQRFDHPGNFYMVGSMGCLAPLSLGVVLASPEHQVIAVDGDGAVLMRAGALATNAYYIGRRLFHLVLDNHSYESTGGQACVSAQVDFPSMAMAMGYPQVLCLHTLEELQQALQAWLIAPVLTFATLRIQSGSLDNLGRPTQTPPELKKRFSDFLSHA